MKSGSKLKGRQNAAPGGDRSGNHRSMQNVLEPKMRGKTSAPGASVGRPGNTRNQPKTAPVPKTQIGRGTPDSYFANSRSPVHPAFDTKKKHD